MPKAIVTLREVTADTFEDICNLSRTLEPPQNKAVAPNVFSLAKASFHTSTWTRAIYADETPVGFLMLDDKPADPLYFLWRFMIAAPHQGKGYGRQAIARLIDHVKTRPNATRLLVSCIEGEGSPENFYTSCGFTRTGVMHGSEVELGIDLQALDPTYQPLPPDPTDEGPLRRHRTASLIRSYFDRVINQRDLTACTERLAPSYIDHDAPAITPPGPDTTIAYYKRYFAENPEYSAQIEDLLVDGQKASLRLIYEGRDAAGSAFTRTGIIILHLDDNDQFVERWSCYEE